MWREKLLNSIYDVIILGKDFTKCMHWKIRIATKTFLSLWLDYRNVFLISIFSIFIKEHDLFCHIKTKGSFYKIFPKEWERLSGSWNSEGDGLIFPATLPWLSKVNIRERWTTRSFSFLVMTHTGICYGRRERMKWIKSHCSKLFTALF